MTDQDPTLSDLIQGALNTGLTLRQLAERATDPRSGETVSKDTINKIVLGRINRMPIEEHLRGIAAALDLPYERVRQAAIKQWLPSEVPTNATGNADDERHDRMLQRLEEARSTISELEREIGQMHSHQRERPKSA
jgi:transcriptional regulator with XRE-family HTH domain